jgi:hypothetical protein
MFRRSFGKFACHLEVAPGASLMALYRPMARVPGKIQVMEGVLHFDAVFNVVQLTGVDLGEDLLQLFDAVADVVAKDNAIEFWHACPKLDDFRFGGGVGALGVPSGVEVVRDMEEIEEFAGDEIDEVGHGCGVEVEAGVGGGEDDAGVSQGFVVGDVDGAEGHFAVADDEFAALFEGDGGGAGDEVVAQAVGHGGEGVAGAGDDDHAIMKE